MAKEQTEAQFLADLLCRRKGKKENLPLPNNYWNLPEWKVEYKRNILAANKFLKVYPFEVIKTVLTSKKFEWVYSLHFPGLKQPLIEENSRYERSLIIKQEQEKNRQERVDIESTGKAPEIIGDKVSLRSRLD